MEFAVKNYLLAVLCYTGIVHGVAIEVDENDAVTIQCPLNIQYPTWTGPKGLANPLTEGHNIIEPGFAWVNNTDLKIAKAMLKHDGNYTCSDGNGNSRTVEVEVQFVSAWAEHSAATTENTTFEATCWCHSKPSCKIVPHIVRKGSNITFKPCELTPHVQKQTKCSTVAVMHVSREDNGLEMSCAFEYKNSTVSTSYIKVKVIFPPTIVNITVEQDNFKLTLKCSTDSSNPVSSLTWRRGSRPQASDNNIIRSNYASYIMPAEYGGKNITESIDIEKESIRHEEKAFCCSGQLCDSVALDAYVAQISGARTVTAWVTLLFAGIVFLQV
ncbi:uncharacterized protein LOC123560241 [Mercenaria mercenaria]|uniref:uncharacterized protein LOC123560241 n=1 Tax=Mercenaria mercenaria TaxID=6596 RepID=UPI001E1DBE73|nr:uncharacterized protein LOC123560241 [Mercenaria mercenaria]